MSRTEIFRLLAIYLTISILIYGITSVSKRRFSSEWLTRVTTESGKSKQMTTDPCAYSITGDPDAGNDFVRLIIHCQDGKSGLSTFDTKAMRIETVEDLLREFQRINGVTAEIKSYKCNQDSAPRTITSKITFPTTIECFYEK